MHSCTDDWIENDWTGFEPEILVCWWVQRRKRKLLPLAICCCCFYFIFLHSIRACWAILLVSSFGKKKYEAKNVFTSIHWSTHLAKLRTCLASSGVEPPGSREKGAAPWSPPPQASATCKLRFHLFFLLLFFCMRAPSFTSHQKSLSLFPFHGPLSRLCNETDKTK